MTRAVMVSLLAALATTAHADPPRRAGRAVRLEHHAANPTLGPRDALVTMELYFVPGSDEGVIAYRALVELAARHPQRLRVVFRPRQIGSRQGVSALALAAHRQGRFFALMDALAAMSPAPSPSASLARAVAIGLDRELMLRADRDPNILATLTANEHRAFRAPTTELPELVINGEPTSSAPVRVSAGATTVEILDGLYQTALADARLAAAQGLAPGTMPRWGHWNLWCAEPDGPDPTVWMMGGPPAPPPPAADAAPRFAWSLHGLVDRGTGCAAARFRPARLDELDAYEPSIVGRVLLERPLPVDGAPALGDPDAAVPVVVACNIMGPACRMQLGLLRPLVEIYQGRVRLVWVPLGDLDLDGQRPDVRVALAATCAAALGDGWPFTSDPSGFQDGPPTVESLARGANADPAVVAACAEGDLTPVLTSIAVVQASGILWGPTVVIGGRTYVGGFVDARSAAAAIEVELAPGLLERLAP